MDISEKTTILLNMAAKKALQDAPEYCPAIIVDDEDPLLALVSTLARVKTVEVNIMKAAVTTETIEASGILSVVNDVQKMVVLIHVATGTLTEADVKSYFGDDYVDSKTIEAAKNVMKTNVSQSPAETLKDLETYLRRKNLSPV